MKPKVAIACQGGGSQTAFTAGVLKALFENKIQDYFKIVSLGDTSGGAICALLIWYALKKGEDPERPYHIPMIEMSEDLAQSLNYESKLDRSPEKIKQLIEDGEKQGKQFLETRLSQMGLS